MNLTYFIEDLDQVATQLLKKSHSKNILLYGSMGVGKTTLVKQIAKKLGVKDNLSSPTFSLVNEYEIPDGKICHFDFYRIEDEVEAMDIGVEEYFDSGHWNFIEWPEKIANILPEDHTVIRLHKNDNGSRTITMTPMK